MKPVLKILLLAAAAALLLLVAGLAWMKLAPRRVPAGQPSLVTLAADTMPAFLDIFNRGEGRIRVLVLLSPT